MKNVRHVLFAVVAVLALAAAPLLLTGCTTHGDHPEGSEHPAGSEHPEK